ncbi:transcription repressor OFP8-like [Lolium rigidum]|uniref:transcription repressor OFP8-like n=1 Tax=Lolium rigidum TaxID=89674 RepID=UPI001F5D922C|nr:transcription repressor OFP8-like [Lolium rigidum]
MSTSSRARRGGGRQFAVGGRLRHVAVVDAGCGCRPRRPRLPALMSLPSFLRPAPKPPVPAPGSSISSLSRSSSFFPSSASTASSATYSSSSASYKQHGQPPAVPYGVTAKASAPARVAGSKAARRKREKAAAAEQGDEDGVGVAVEKESSDPRADFRDSMVQMVVEMGLCDWDGLRCMLRRLLALNAPRHHAAILAAFAEVCAQLASDPPPQPPAYHYDYYY